MRRASASTWKSVSSKVGGKPLLGAKWQTRVQGSTSTLLPSFSVVSDSGAGAFSPRAAHFITAGQSLKIAQMASADASTSPDANADPRLKFAIFSLLTLL